MRKRRSLSSIAGAVVLLAMVAIPAVANPANSPVQYSVKYVCGFVPVQPAGEESGVKPGNYATAVNIHNWTQTVNIPVAVRVTIHYRDGNPLPAAPAPVTQRAFRFRTLEIDCPVIWQIVGVPPGTYLKGMLHLGLPQRLPIAAVYTSQTNLGGAAGLDAGAGISIDVEYVEPFFDVPTMPGIEPPPAEEEAP